MMASTVACHQDLIPFDMLAEVKSDIFGVECKISAKNKKPGTHAKQVMYQ